MEARMLVVVMLVGAAVHSLPHSKVNTPPLPYPQVNDPVPPQITDNRSDLNDPQVNEVALLDPAVNAVALPHHEVNAPPVPNTDANSPALPDTALIKSTRPVVPGEISVIIVKASDTAKKTGSIRSAVTTTTLDPFDEYCKEACEEGVGGPECDCPDHPIG
ncbi:hypothetical protein Hamer_G018000 [Homarus americanus]|uniref:Uncharacterized protein n=1 Tax=Homarus americanus TaxID=6706 RepID=A0A8J5N5C2_HOMAM|nr:hypothetical protein Hamer_G018000 [Homarus americanus]